MIYTKEELDIFGIEEYNNILDCTLRQYRTVVQCKKEGWTHYPKKGFFPPDQDNLIDDVIKECIDQLKEMDYPMEKLGLSPKLAMEDMDEQQRFNHEVQLNGLDNEQAEKLWNEHYK